MNSTLQESTPSVFLPISLIALSSIVLLTWNLIIVVNQHYNGVRISAQQEIQFAQAMQTETKLKQMMSDLVDLSKTDTGAETIVKRYRIAFTPQAGNPDTQTPVKKAPTKDVKAPAKAPAKANVKAPDAP
ncbi:MAG: hypothetical protein WCO77_01910 [bacterium]